MRCVRSRPRASVAQKPSAPPSWKAAQRLRRRSELAAEVAALEADEDDREEMLAVAGLMEALRAPR